MDEKAMGFNETQLKRAGFAEAFTPQLQQKMKEGLPNIQHVFKKEYDGDKVEAVLHLKKSATSDYYFLNKFDLGLQKEGHPETIKQTFYLTTKLNADAPDNSEHKGTLENRYTLKAAYNLLDGRPAKVMLANKEGEQYDAWVKLNFKNQLVNGNYETKQYTKNYGFDLENVLAKYPIRELANAQYKQSLVDSLERGNLQKVTFVDKTGKEEKLFVSPNITLAALNVYDLGKQPLSPESLIEKQYISKEMVGDLNERIRQKQNQRQTIKTEAKPPLTQDQKQDSKQDLKQKQKIEKPEKKQTRKQKVH